MPRYRKAPVSVLPMDNPLCATIENGSCCRPEGRCAAREIPRPAREEGGLWDHAGVSAVGLSYSLIATPLNVATPIGLEVAAREMSP